MADRPIFTTGSVKAGRLKVRNANRVERELKRWKADCEVVITIERKRATRSAAQNRAYFGLILRSISDHTGDHVDDLHTHFKREFNSKPITFCGDGGVILHEDKVGQSTRKLDKIQFGEYMDRIVQFAAEMEIVIPDPDPDYAWKGETK